MNNQLLKNLLLLFAWLSPLLGWATITLPPLVGDNMVLQRDTNVNLWGWAAPGEKVSLQFRGKHLTTKADPTGKWTLVLPALPAGGPYEMVIKGQNTLTLHNILLGDVWLASGQSNMEWPLNNINNSAAEIKTADNPQIRLFTVNKTFAFAPKGEIPATGWEVCSPKAAEHFSAVAYLFGREMQQRYQVPVGLVFSAWGGTTAEAWTSTEGLKPLPAFEKPLAELSKTDMARYQARIAQKEAWSKAFGNIDRGRTPNAQPWTATDLPTADWATMQQPGLWSANKALKGYSGTIWFRKDLAVPAAAAGKPVELNLGTVLWSDSVFFNGQFVGKNTGYDKKRQYKVPGNLVKAGRNVVVLRIKGASNFGGLTSQPEEIYAQIGADKMPLAGEWRYKTAPDISGLPEEDVLSNFNPQMPETPTLLFNGMIAPLIPYTIKGAIWYQGESNADNMAEASQYYTLFPAMVKDWRRRWGYDFPFVFVQLAGYQPDKPQPADYPWARVREAQSKTLSLPNTGMATAIDIGEEKDIHPRNKQDVAHRLALAAQKAAYHDQVVAAGPTLKSMRVEGDKVRLSFDNLGTGLRLKSKYGYVQGFALAGADKTFVWAKGYQEGNDIVVQADQVKQPVAVRYDWSNTPDGNVYNKENLPAAPFRTDDW